ncbi:murein hydrolase regulator LrgA [Azoarcus sp. DD4]|uniref:CidA/LrgA family protein n=1 Tax=Azoarcus sp. DD4 TaxID=2027405 RepID=UPI001128730F|nr:CidA/LrgA family protein [Azoarcus sp. DD4]QDF96288.1 murein hydrolase regulator LrgA [Azoarcus sp. DD4]
MLGALTLLLVFQLVGEVTARAFALPIPGPVIGMALLFLTLVVRGGAGDDLRQTAGTLLQHLSLLFVPAGTGIVLYGSRIADEWLPLGVALVGSTALAIAVTALVLNALTRRRAAAGIDEERRS